MLAPSPSPCPVAPCPQARNQRALALLLSKDATIQELRAQLAAAGEELEANQTAAQEMEAVTDAMVTAQQQAASALAQASALQQQLDEEREQHREEVVRIVCWQL
jgi:predicted  nucleic acid-binding Zn-ribbon protein